MMSDVPFGVFLSGGIDSSANVALMSKLMDRPVETFTVGFKDHHHLNELDYANRIAKEWQSHKASSHCAGTCTDKIAAGYDFPFL